MYHENRNMKTHATCYRAEEVSLIKLTCGNAIIQRHKIGTVTDGKLQQGRGKLQSDAECCQSLFDQSHG